jgi:integrase/recombinase XerD
MNEQITESNKLVTSPCPSTDVSSQLPVASSLKNYLQQKDLSKATIQHYNSQALAFITWCDIQNIAVENCTSTDITSYLKHLQNKGQQNKTRNINLNVLKHFFEWQIQAEQRQDNPAKHIKIRGIKTKKLYPTFDKQELESLYRSYEIPSDEHNKSKCNWFNNYKLSKQRNKAILSLMIYQGLCTDEVNRLRIQDIKLKEGTVFIAGTRNSNERTLELKPHQIMELMEYQLTTRKELLKLKKSAILIKVAEPVEPKIAEPVVLKVGEPVEAYFLPTPAAGKKTITANDGIHIWKRLSQEIRKTNNKFINFKQVRTSVITHWLKQYNLRQVQYMAGHKYVSSTETYLANQIEDLQTDIEQFHPIG